MWIIRYVMLRCREVAADLKVNLCVYDYSGYGCSTGSPSVCNTIADIDACYAWLLKKGVSASDIVLYGQSIGSGPTINLAARTKGVAGVVLHAAFSGKSRCGYMVGM
jgi:abhydrolase domain-containing protein 17